MPLTKMGKSTGGGWQWELDFGRWRVEMAPAVQEAVLWSAGQRSSIEHFHSRDTVRNPLGKRTQLPKRRGPRTKPLSTVMLRNQALLSHSVKWRLKTLSTSEGCGEDYVR